MSTNKTPTPVGTAIKQFLMKVEQHPSRSESAGPSPATAARLIFALDATASRQPTWDAACQLQADMFSQTHQLGLLQVKLCFYRGYRELRSSPWHSASGPLIRAMSAVRCLGGHTQIGRLLDHALQQHRQQPVKALVFIGDSIEDRDMRLQRLQNALSE